DRSKSIGEIVFEAYVPHHLPYGMIEPGMEETAFYDPANFTYPAGCYVCEVEIDPDTGVVKIDRFIAVDDFGKVINPMIVEGQVHGGLAQGIGQALTEGCVYDETGQLLSASYMDYTMPKADDLPSFQVALTETPCTHNTLGVKGGGQAGAIGPRPAALAPTCRRRRRGCGGRCRAGRCPRRRNREGKAHVCVRISPAHECRGCGRPAPACERGPAARGRPYPAADPEAASGAAFG